MPRTAKTTVTVRMYNMGFGDSFLVTVKQGSTVWRMLVDCGVFPSGQARPVADSVKMIIADLVAASSDGVAHLDVVVATHHHIDHMSGFADPAWAKVKVDDVWVPYVEDPSDPDGKALRGELTTAASNLHSLVATAKMRVAVTNGPAVQKLELAEAFAVNSQGSADGTDRVLGRNGLSFLNTPTPRYLPDRDAAKNVIETTVPGVVAHVLGPSRDPNDVKRMNPPKAVAWLKAAHDERPDDADSKPLFDPIYAVAAADVEAVIPEALRNPPRPLDLDTLSDADELLAAAAILENSVNNTSVYFVLDVKGTRLVFVGDSQYGAWEHVLNDADSLKLVTGPAFYKIGHHGSHNATPKRYVDDVLGEGHYAMMPFHTVKGWPSIPEPKLLADLAAHKTYLIRADAPQPAPQVTIQKDGLWTELSLPVT